MKTKDFAELIDLESEYKDYIRFDLGKSKKYKTYAEWDAHMKSLLVAIESPTDIYNLKRYCADVIRSNNDLSQMFWGYIGLSFPLVLTFITDAERRGFMGIAVLFCLFSFLFYIISISKMNARKKHFHEDVLNVIEQIEHQS